MDKGRRGEARRVSTLWAAHVYYTGQDTRSRGVSRRIDERITGYTQSAGFEGCIGWWMCARRECACAGAGALRTDSITEAGKKPSRKSRGGRLIRWPPRARIVEKSKSRGSILIVFSPSRHFENFLWWIFFLVMIILNSKELIFSSILKKSLDSEDTGSINYTLWFNSFVISFR